MVAVAVAAVLLGGQSLAAGMVRWEVMEMPPLMRTMIPSLSSSFSLDGLFPFLYLWRRAYCMESCTCHGNEMLDKVVSW